MFVSFTEYFDFREGKEEDKKPEEKGEKETPKGDDAKGKHVPFWTLLRRKAGKKPSK